MVTIRLRRNGPYVIEGDDVKVVDWNGAVPGRAPADRPVPLRGLDDEPFRDGTHSKVGFQAAEAAVADSVDKPAQKSVGGSATHALEVGV